MIKNIRRLEKTLENIDADKFIQFRVYYYACLIVTHVIISCFLSISVAFYNIVFYLFLSVVISEIFLYNYTTETNESEIEVNKNRILKYPLSFFTAMPIMLNFIYIMPVVVEDFSVRENQMSTAHGVVTNKEDSNNQYLFLKNEEEISSYNMNFQRNKIDYRKIPASIYGEEVTVKYIRNGSGEFQNSDFLIYDLRSKDNIYLDYESQVLYYNNLKYKSIAYTIMACLCYILANAFITGCFLRVIRSRG